VNEKGIETPYGFFPDVMEQARLEEVCVREGGIQTGPFGSQLHQEDYVTDGTPIITVEHLGDNRIVHQNLPRVCDEDHVRLSRYQLRENDIVFSRVGSVDRRALVRVQEDGWLFSGRCLRIRPDSEKIDPAYLSYFFGLASFKAHIRSIAVGATMPSINTQILSGITVVFPKSLDEQRAIARLLACLDEKIEANRRMNDTLEAMARAMFQSWFIDFDPVRAKAGGETPESICQCLGLAPELLALFPDEFEDSFDGVIPAGWTQSTLGEQAKAHGGFIQTGPFGSQLHASDYVDEGIPVVMPQDMVNRRVSVSKVARVTEDMAQRLSRHALQPGDVVYSRRGDVERHALVSEREAGWLCGTGCLLVRLGAGWSSQAYLSEALDLPATREWLVRHAVGATMPNLNTSILSAVPLLVPPEPLMQAFERMAGPLRRQQIANSLENDSLAETRDALLPQLLSGELRPDETWLGA
jgi:type I restriction enzyme S subunit